MIICSIQLVTLAYKRNYFPKNMYGKLFKKLMHLKTKITVCHRGAKAYTIKLIPCCYVNARKAGPWCSRHAIYLTLLSAEGKEKEEFAHLPYVLHYHWTSYGNFM